MNRIKCIFLSLTFILFVFSLANIYLVTCEFVYNYQGRTGIVLKNNQVLGGDFIAFYTAGLLFRENPAHLYNYKSQQKLQESLYDDVPTETSFLSFAYPPLLAALFSLLTYFSFETAYFGWAFISILFYGLSLIIVLYNLKLNPTHKFFIFLVSLGYPAFYLKTLVGGQTSTLGLLIVSSLFFTFLTKREFLAGVAMAFSYYKPPIFLFIFICFLLSKKRKFVLGFFILALPLILASVLLLPFSALLDYLHISMNYSYGGVRELNLKSMPNRGAGLYAILVSYLPLSMNVTRSLFFVTVVSFIVFYHKKIKSSMENCSELFLPGFSIIVSLTLYLSIYILDYDLSILIIPFVLTLSYAYINRHFNLLITGLSIVILFYIDLALPDVYFDSYRLSILSFLNSLWIIFVLFYWHKIEKQKHTIS